MPIKACILERVEKDTAILETQSKKMINLPVDFLPDEAKEGDVITFETKLDIEKTNERRKTIKDDFFNLFGE